MSTMIKIDIESLRAVAKDLRNIAMIAGVRGEELVSRGGSLETVPTKALSGVAPCVEKLKDQASSLDARVDTAILINSGDGKNVPQTGVITYQIDGNDSTEPKEVKRQLGLAIASLGSDISLHDLGPGGGERIKLLRSQLAHWSNDSSVMGTLFDTLNPEGSLRIMSILGKRASSTFDSSKEEHEDSRAALNLMKLGLGNATKEWSAEKAEKFGQDMVSASTRRVDGKIDNGMYEAMAFVAYKNTSASGDFIRGTLNNLHKIETEFGAALQGAQTPVFLHELVGQEDYGWASDIPTSLLRDLSSRPESAMRFFSEDEERADYWVKHRYYNDDYYSVASALDAASTDPTVRAKFPEKAARIAALAINGLGSVGVGKVNSSPWGVDVGGVEAAKPLTHILTTYMDAVNYSIVHDETTGDTNEVARPTGSNNEQLPVIPIFHKENLNGVLNVASRDDQSFLDLRAAQNDYQRSRLTESNFRDAAQNDGKVEGFIAKAMGGGKIEEAEERDKYAKAWIDLAGLPANKVKGLLASTIPAGKVKDYANGTGGHFIDMVIGLAEERWANSAEGAEKNAEKDALAARKQYARNLLFAADEKGLAGYQNPDNPPLGEHNAAAVKRPDGTYRLMTRSEYGKLVEDARPVSQREGEADSDFRQRKAESDSAKQRLEEVDRSLSDIASSRSGYMDKVTRQDIEEAFGSAFLEYYNKGGS